MRVYRCITLQEVINKYKNKKMDINSNNKCNTYSYQPNKEYIHFFRYEEFAIYYFNLKKSGCLEILKDDFIFFMVANIPENILKKNLSFGFYTFKGKEIAMPEYAIPLEEFLPEYVVDMTTYPRGDYGRRDEEEEFNKYIALFNELRARSMSTQKIANFLLENNFEELLEIEIDKRTEEEYSKETDGLISSISFLNCNDEEIQDFGRK